MQTKVKILHTMEFIFDTNAYRNLAHGISLGEAIVLAKKLKYFEKSKGHKSAVSTVVIMELMQHLVKGDPAMDDCYKALCMAFHHTSRVNYKENKLEGNFYPPMNIILAQFFFGENSKYANLYNKVIDLFLELVKDGDIEKCTAYQHEIIVIKEQILFEKNEFRSNVEDFLAFLNDGVIDWKYINNNKEERKKFFQKIQNGEMAFLLANALMIRAHQVMDATDWVVGAEEKLQQFFGQFKAAILMNLTLLESIGHGAEKMKDVNDERWNTLNDMQIMFGVLYTREDGEEKALVTEEKKIKASAEAANIGEKILTINDYKALIGFEGQNN